MKAETFDELVNTNIRAPFFLTQACLPYIPRGGRIILLSSISARAPSPAVTVPLYAMTKAANEALARDWAVEFGHSRGINVNGTSGTFATMASLRKYADYLKSRCTGTCGN